MSEREDRAFQSWREASEKYDYFMAGLSAALVAYLAPTLEPTRLGWSPEALELACMLALVGSTLAAIKRLESFTHSQQIGWILVKQREKVSKLEQGIHGEAHFFDSDSREPLASEQLQSRLEHERSLAETVASSSRTVREKASRWSRWRNNLLVLGFLLLLIARVWKGYE